MTGSPETVLPEYGDVVFTVAQVTKLLGLDRLTLLRMRKRGDGPAFVRLSPNRIGYAARDIREFLASRRQTQSGSRGEQSTVVRVSNTQLNGSGSDKLTGHGY